MKSVSTARPSASPGTQRGGSHLLSAAFDNPRLSDKVLLLVAPPPLSAAGERTSGTKRKADEDEPFVRLHVSSAVLAGNSEFFMSLFTNGMKESAETEVRVSIEPELAPLLRDAIRFLYTGAFETPLAEMLGVLNIADRFSLPAVADAACEALLESEMTLPVAVECLQREDGPLNSCKPLVEAARDFLGRRFAKLAVEQTSIEFLSLPPRAVAAVFSSDHLHVETENIVFQAFARWFQENGLDPQSVKQILHTVRFAHLDTPYLIDVAMKFVKNDVPLASLFERTLASALAFKSCSEVPWRQDPRFDDAVFQPRKSYTPKSTCRLEWTVARESVPQRSESPLLGGCRGASWYLVVRFLADGKVAVYVATKDEAYWKVKFAFKLGLLYRHNGVDAQASFNSSTHKSVLRDFRSGGQGVKDFRGLKIPADAENVRLHVTLDLKVAAV